ncbi:hypothetical protein [Carp edema virus]|nr:hypothetical protein [Carp edema virus]
MNNCYVNKLKNLKQFITLRDLNGSTFDLHHAKEIRFIVDANIVYRNLGTLEKKKKIYDKLFLKFKNLQPYYKSKYSSNVDLRKVEVVEDSIDSSIDSYDSDHEFDYLDYMISNHSCNINDSIFSKANFTKLEETRFETKTKFIDNKFKNVSIRAKEMPIIKEEQLFVETSELEDLDLFQQDHTSMVDLDTIELEPDYYSNPSTVRNFIKKVLELYTDDIKEEIRKIENDRRDSLPRVPPPPPPPLPDFLLNSTPQTFKITRSTSVKSFSKMETPVLDFIYELKEVFNRKSKIRSSNKDMRVSLIFDAISSIKLS